MLQFFAEMSWLIPCYPFIGMLLSILWSPAIIRRTGPRPAGYINLLMTFVALLHGVLAFPATWGQSARYIEIVWLRVSDLTLTLPLEISSLTVGAMVLLTGLNLLAQLYGVGYLQTDWGWGRFYTLMALFEAGMCGLVLCNSLFFSYIVLEILTLGTYLLIGMWFNQPIVVTGARDAFLTKRVGDLFLLMGVLALYPLAGTWNFDGLAQWAQTAEVDPIVAALIGLALISGPIGKCAQFPLHLWLDEAMEGPLPSTILRNAVVVATGAWVIIKLAPVLALSPITLSVTIAIGVISAIGGSLIAIAQIDVKRALSYSVSAYMGLVFIAVGTQHIQSAYLLLLTHAVAMALLVMGVGGIILNCITQDLTQLGGLWSRRPIAGLTFLTGAAGLIALPPLSGFSALLKLVSQLWSTHPLLAAVVLVVNALTAFSLMRIFALIFGGRPTQMTIRAPEVNWEMTLPTVILAVFALHLPLILRSLDIRPVGDANLSLLLIWSSFFGASLSALVYFSPVISKPVNWLWSPLRNLFAYDFYTRTLYQSSVVLGVDALSRITDWFDRYFVDSLVNLVGLASIFGGETLKYNNTGRTQFYMLTISFWVALIAILMNWSTLSQLVI
ncbi:MAG: NAD(P)H-quinone oxidoreductase subunit F [Leptolyngbyaceae cyanobacterium MO_188.B28]|nr:NAD(P)H-quinone oxidoreductase subunit F [Leptolyngbyaceae cyanobacterium MO_188.B28]